MTITKESKHVRHLYNLAKHEWEAYRRCISEARDDIDLARADRIFTHLKLGRSQWEVDMLRAHQTIEAAHYHYYRWLQRMDKYNELFEDDLHNFLNCNNCVHAEGLSNYDCNCCNMCGCTKAYDCFEPDQRCLEADIMEMEN